jgi:hypothetical protein
MGLSFGGQSFSMKDPIGNMRQAGKAQGRWIRKAAEARRAGYDNAMNRWEDTFKPYQGFGGERVQAWDKLLEDPSSISSNPGYNFRRTQGQEALENSAASRGGLLSGNALRAIQEYGQDYASNEYDKALDREARGAQFGATVDTNYANALANLEKERGASNAQEYGDYSNYAFWHEQQGMDEAKQWMGFLRGALGGMGGGNSGVKGNQKTVMGNQGSGSGSGNGQNSFLSYYDNQANDNSNWANEEEFKANNYGFTDEEDNKRGQMYLGY